MCYNSEEMDFDRKLKQELLNHLKNNDIHSLRGCMMNEQFTRIFNSLSIVSFVKDLSDEMLLFLVQINYPYCKSILNFCFYRGFIGKIRFMISIGYEINRQCLIYAIKNNKQDVIKEFVHFKYNPLDQHYYTYYASSYNRVEILDYLFKIGCVYDNEVSLIASQKGFLQVLHLILKQPIIFIHPDAINTALINRNIECFKLLVSVGCVSNEVFSYLNKNLCVIDLDEEWWRRLLFKNESVNEYPQLQRFVQSKKLDIQIRSEKIIESIHSITCSYELEDVIKYVCKEYL